LPAVCVSADARSTGVHNREGEAMHRAPATRSTPTALVLAAAAAAGGALCTSCATGRSPLGQAAGKSTATGPSRERDASGRGPAESAASPHVLSPDWGERGERARSYDLKHIRFALDIDPKARHIRGEVTSTVAPFADGATEIELDAEELHILEARVGGRSASFQVGPKSVKVRLPQPVAAGSDVDVTLRYEGNPRNGLHWVGPEPGYPDKPLEVWSQGEDTDNHFWLPTWDYPNDRTTWESALTVPADLVAVSNGQFLGDAPGPRPGTRTWRYRMAEPNVTYLIAIAVGPWERFTDSWRGKPVEYFVPRGTGEATARRAFGDTPAMIEYFSRQAIGVDYPWSKYAQIAVAEFVVSGMENVSATLQTDRALRDERGALDHSSETLVAHELAHQWFGDLLTCRSWDHLWLNEGFATYFEVLYLEHRRGRDEMQAEMAQNQRRAVEEDDVGAPAPLVETYFTRDHSKQPLELVYTRGSSVLHMLRFVLGDRAFFRVIHEYVTHHRGKSVDSEDLRRVIADVTGQPLEWFFQEWVYGAGWPAFEVTASWDATRKVEQVVVKQTQKVGGLVPYFRMPVDIKLVAGGKRQVHRVWVSQAEDRFELPAAQPPSLVAFDDGDWLLKTVHFEKSTADLVWQLEHDDQLAGRLQATHDLAERVTDPAATAALAQALRSRGGHQKLREELAEALSNRRRGPVAQSALLAGLSDPDAHVRAAVAEALGAFVGQTDVAEALERTMTSDRSYATQGAAIKSLGRVLGRPGFEVVSRGLALRSPEERVATAAMEALAELDPVRALPRVLEAASAGRPYAMRLRALATLGRMASDIDGSERGRVFEALDQALAADYYRARTSAIRALGRLGGERARERLERAAREEASPEFRKLAKRTAESVKSGVTLKDENQRLKRRVEQLERELRAPGGEAPARADGAPSRPRSGGAVQRSTVSALAK
jgi:aminopeptidase N